MSPSQLSKVINGKSGINVTQATKIIEKLKPLDEDANRLLNDIHPLIGLNRESIDSTEKTRLREDEFKLISDWYHFAILSLCRLQDNKADPLWIAAQIGIDADTADSALLRLKRLELVMTKRNKMYRTSNPITTSKDIPSESIKSYHKQNLILAAQKLDSVPIDKRDFASITTAVDPKKINKAKKMIVDFIDKLSIEMSSKTPSEVYTLSVHLFPLTHNETRP